jgi:pilus assembly protein CpaB
MRRPIVFVLLAGVAALVAAIVVYSALKKREAQVQDAMVKSINVVVAARDLPIGSKLDANAVKLVRWSKDDMPPGAFTEPGPLLNQFTKTGFVQNEPIVADRLFGGDKNAGVLPLLIPSGMRAVSVPVDEVSDIAGFVLPHARVDLVVSVANAQGSNNQQFSKIVLQNVEVLAVAQEIENAGADKPEVVRVVTLLVTPEEAERVVLASHEGQLRLAMRNYEDKKIVATSGVDVAELLRSYGGPVAVQPKQIATAPIPSFAPRVKPVEVEVLRNGKSVENVSFVHGHGGSGGSEEKTAPPETSSAHSSDKVATAAPADDSGEAASKGAGITAATDGAVRNLAGIRAGAETGTSAAPKSPRMKTIDVP